MKKSLINLFENQSATMLAGMVESYAAAKGIQDTSKVDQKALVKELDAVSDAMHGMFTGRTREGKPYEGPELNLTEALGTTDAPFLFKRVIRELLDTPREPAFFLMNEVAQEIALSPQHPNYIELVRIGAIQADEVPTNGDYPSQKLSATEDIIKMTLRKWGVMMAVGDEVVAKSIYPVLRIMLQQMRTAVERRMEEELAKTLKAAATTVFDNEDSSSSHRTTGVDATQTWNATLDWKDFNDMIAVVVNNEYNPTHVLGHPLGWGIFANDPFLRATFFHGGQVGGSIHRTPPQFDQQVNLPYALRYVPYYNVDHYVASTLTGAGSSLAATLLTDLYVLDAQNALFMLTQGGADMDKYQDWFKDATALKVRRYAEFASKDGGKPIARTKKIRVELNYAPLFTVRNTT
jgi:hypothetical protein